MMLLHLDSSALGANSVTRQLSAAAVSHWTAGRPDATVAYRDLDREPLPHLNSEALDGGAPEAAADAAQTLQAFLDADVIVLGAPMYNFGVPSTLKAWIDRVAVAGKTFRYTEHGPQGLAGGKTVIVATAAGGMHAGQPTDFVEPYLRQVFGFLGIEDVRVIRAEGVAYSPEHRTAAIAQALDTLSEAPRLAA